MKAQCLDRTTMSSTLATQSVNASLLTDLELRCFTKVVVTSADIEGFQLAWF
jgi:hypothetical protein